MSWCLAQTPPHPLCRYRIILSFNLQPINVTKKKNLAIVLGIHVTGMEEMLAFGMILILLKADWYLKGYYW